MRGLIDDKPCQQCVLDLLFLYFKVECLAHHAAAGPDHVIFGGDQLVGRAIVVVGVRLPAVVAGAAIVGHYRLLHQILPSSGLVDPDGAKGGHSEARPATWGSPVSGAGVCECVLCLAGG